MNSAYLDLPPIKSEDNNARAGELFSLFLRDNRLGTSVLFSHDAENPVYVVKLVSLSTRLTYPHKSPQVNSNCKQSSCQKTL